MPLSLFSISSETLLEKLIFHLKMVIIWRWLHGKGCETYIHFHYQQQKPVSLIHVEALNTATVPVSLLVLVCLEGLGVTWFSLYPLALTRMVYYLIQRFLNSKRKDLVKRSILKLSFPRSLTFCSFFQACVSLHVPVYYRKSVSDDD